MHHQVMKQAKAGESKLRNAWEKAKAENGPSKQNVSFTIMFSCLTPMSATSNATRQAWKGSNRLSGWMTSLQIAKLQGADPQDPSFKELEKAAVKGLEERPHEVKAWADMGVKQ